jgi:YD repeat-containing protein
MTRGAVQQNRTFTYDGNFNMTSENTPDGGLVTYAYDGNHHVTERVDAIGQKDGLFIRWIRAADERAALGVGKSLVLQH